MRAPGWQCTVKWSIALILVLGAVGCQTATPHPSSPPHDESFTGLWETYRHCQASEDPMEMKADVFRLDETVQTMHEDTSSALIPDGIERLVDERPSRLAVDPRAMAASCALLAGYQARAAGQPQLAAEMFAHIVSHYPRSNVIDIMWSRPTTVSNRSRAANAFYQNNLYLLLQSRNPRFSSHPAFLETSSHRAPI